LVEHWEKRAFGPKEKGEGVRPGCLFAHPLLRLLHPRRMRNRINVVLYDTDIFAGALDLYQMVVQFVGFNGYVERCFPISQKDPLMMGDLKLLYMSAISERTNEVCWARVDDWCKTPSWTTLAFNPKIEMGAPCGCIVADELWSNTTKLNIERFCLTDPTVSLAPIELICNVSSEYKAYHVSRMVYVPSTNTLWMWPKSLIAVQLMTLSLEGMLLHHLHDLKSAPPKHEPNITRAQRDDARALPSTVMLPTEVHTIGGSWSCFSWIEAPDTVCMNRCMEVFGL
jgi:hypothetical protein